MISVYITSILSGFLYGVVESINKEIVRKEYSAFSYAFLQWGLNALLYLVPFLLWGKIPFAVEAYFYLFLMILTIIIGNVSIIKAYKTADVSNLSIIARISLVIAALSGVIFLNENLTISIILGIFLIITGVIIIFYEGKKIRYKPGYLWGLVSGISYGLAVYPEKMALKYFDIISLLFIFFLINALIMLIHPKTWKDALSVFAKFKKKIILSRLLVIMASYLFAYSLNKGHISIVNTNGETVFLLTTLFIGVVFLGERKNIAQKIIGSFFCIIGIILINRV